MGQIGIAVFGPQTMEKIIVVAESSQVTQAEYEATNIGDELTILYNPRRPQSNAVIVTED